MFKNLYLVFAVLFCTLCMYSCTLLDESKELFRRCELTSNCESGYECHCGICQYIGDIAGIRNSSLNCDNQGNTECFSDSNCERGSVCEENTCVELQCESLLDCPGYDRTCIPDLEICTAYECTNDSDCSDKLFCNEYLCVENISCSNSCDCSSEMICNIVTGTCVPAQSSCESDNHCPCEKFCSNENYCIDGCSSDEECISSEFCDKHSHQCEYGCRNNSGCRSDEICANHQCVHEACTPGSCSDGERCNTDLGLCEIFGDLRLCESCANDDQCGSSADQCTILSESNESFCTAACDIDIPGICDAGYTCYPVSSNSSQCIPFGNECKLCHIEGCPPNMWCNASSGECEQLSGICQQCSIDYQCEEGYSCALLELRSYCFSQCSTTSCPNEYSCNENQICMPDSGNCQPCDSLPTCNSPTPYTDEVNCRCVSCLEHSQCEQGLLCSPDFQSCYWADAECTSDSDCEPDTKCAGGLCVECISQMDCPDDMCIQGRCHACECEPDFRCDPWGNCIEIPENCSGPEDCIASDGQQGICDSDTDRCYLPGYCGSADPFFSECPTPLVCQEVVQGQMTNCYGCDMLTIPCREGELCLFESCIAFEM